MEPKKEGHKEKSQTLTAVQRKLIEELVRITPQVIKTRVRRDGISAVKVMNVYTNNSLLFFSDESNLP